MRFFNLSKINIGLSDIFIFAIISIFASWTLAYHAVLLIRLPSLYLPFFWLGLIFVECIIFKRFILSIAYKRVLTSSNLAIVAIFGLISLLTLFTLRPDNDDVEFFHRAYLQSFHLKEAIYTHETMLNFIGLPPISILHLTTSYEYFVVLISKVIHINPVIVYQNLMSFIVSIVTLLTYYFLFRLFGLKRKTSLMAVLLTSLFLIIDGNVHRSFGNVSFVRLWQGKTILWTTLIPMSMFITYKFINTKSYFYLGCLVMISICGVGLSNSGVFLIPVFLGVFVIAYLLSTYILEKKLQKDNYLISIWILISSGYSSLFAVFILFGVLHGPKDNVAWVFGWPSNWFDNFLLPFGDIKTLIRSLIIVFLSPLLVLPFRKSLFLIIFSLSLFIVCFNPVTGPLLMTILLPGSYWRLVYLLPVPFCFGLLAQIIEITKINAEKIKYRSISVIGCILILIVTVFTTEKTTLSSTEVSMKYPLEYKFDSIVLASAKRIDSVLDGHFNILAPDDIVTVLPLINPNVRFEAGRTSSVQHYFIEYGLPEEGLRRQNSKAYIETLEPTLIPDFTKSIESGVNAVIVKNANIAAVARQLGMSEGTWSIALIDDNYTVFLKDERKGSRSIGSFSLPEGLEFLETQNENVVGNVDSIEEYSNSVVMEGWIKTLNKLPATLLITDQNNHVLTITKNIYDRPDVMEYFKDPHLKKTGWIAIINKKDLSVENRDIRIYYIDETRSNAVLFRQDVHVELD